MPRSTGELRGHFASHARGLSAVALASIVGVIAAFAFQIASARYLEPADFGLLASFLNIISIAAIGSSALQNIVTVNTAAAMSADGRGASERTRVPWEAIAIGAGGGIVLAAVSPLLASALDTSAVVVLAAAACIPLSFVFADALGLLQGSGRVAGAVWWSTISLVGRIVLLVITVAFGFGVGGVIGAVLAATAISVIGALWSARRIPRPDDGVFSVTGLTIVVVTVAFAWLIAADVIFLRAGTPPSVTGNYAAVVVLVKAGFLVPSTLSLYLLPRFVRARNDPRLGRIGVLVLLGLSVAAGLVMIAGFGLFGDVFIHLLYGDAYEGASELLVPVALAYLPWMAAQGMLVKVTSNASIGAAAVAVAAVAVQWLAFSATLPDVSAMLVWFGLLGMVVLAAFVVFDALRSRRLTSTDGIPS